MREVGNLPTVWRDAPVARESGAELCERGSGPAVARHAHQLGASRRERRGEERLTVGREPDREGRGDPLRECRFVSIKVDEDEVARLDTGWPANDDGVAGWRPDRVGEEVDVLGKLLGIRRADLFRP